MYWIYVTNYKYTFNMKRPLDLSINPIEELKSLFAEGLVDITDPRVINSLYYKKMQTETELYLCRSNLSPEFMLLLVRIAAISPTINTVNMSCTNLGKHGPEIATALAESSTIHTVIMDENYLAELGPQVATALAASPIIHTVRMSSTGLREHGPETAAALAESHTIHTVDMSCNYLREHGPETAYALAASSTIHTVNMSGNDLCEHGPETAAALAESPTIHTVYIGQNDLHEHGPETAAALVSSNTIHTIDMMIDDFGDDPATQAIFDNHNAQIVDKAVLIKLLGYELGLTQDLVGMLGTYLTYIDYDL